MSATTSETWRIGLYSTRSGKRGDVVGSWGASIPTVMLDLPARKELGARPGRCRAGASQSVARVTGWESGTGDLECLRRSLKCRGRSSFLPAYEVYRR